MGEETGTGYNGGIKKGLTIDRYFSSDDGNVYGGVDWKKTDARITDDNGKLLFVQRDAEFPKNWSQNTIDIVASRYFYGKHGTPQREYSVKQLIERVSETMEKWGVKRGYFSSQEDADTFKDEIAALTLNQKMAFNSPVWFNVGVDRYNNLDGKTISDREAYIINDSGQVEHIPSNVNDYEYPQTSACFIQDVRDNMPSIMNLSKKEALLFKYGSGTGTNLSTLRASREDLSGGGIPSGPLAYLKFYDCVAGIVKSGGKTRRAAKMDILNDTHPDIEDFIIAKSKEEEKIRALMREGYSWREAQDTVAYQNTNLSARVSDKFMMAVGNDEEWRTYPVHSDHLADKMPVFRAKDLFRKIAECAHDCGDPGVQFDDKINEMHTCSNSGRINASNPCSEYMFIDNSSCNLASLNVKNFMDENGRFNVEAFGNAIRKTVIAQDLEIDNSSYPTPEIAENSHKFRPLGTGYSNLGALVMSLGYPYDSDEARNIGASLMAFLTAKVYETSTEMAEKIGPFEEYEKNKEPMLKVMEKHKSSLSLIDKDKLPEGLEGILDEAYKTWDTVIERGEIHGFRNAQASVLAPTGTISFMMGCDTTGIEPDLGLYKVKKLAEGGTMTIINGSVALALKKLGYDNKKTESILNYIKENKTIEGSELKDEHLPVFDTSFKPNQDGRYISAMGHVKMLAAVQPFVSGAISKTVNLPNDASIDDIVDVYMNSWKMGLKSIAVYRDGSKARQPLSSGGLESKVDKSITPIRRKLPNERDGRIHKFDISGHEGYITVGEYEDGSPGEVFITMSKEGSMIGGLMDTTATLISIALQYGVPLEKLEDKFRYQRFEPSGIVYEGHKDIKTASSIIDYVFHWIGKRYLPKKEENENKATNDNNNNNIEKENAENRSSFENGKSCPNCESLMSFGGGCNYVCPECNRVDQVSCGG